MESIAKLTGATVRRGTTAALVDLDFEVKPGERWVVLGPNGAGKTTLMLLLATQLHPASGEVRILGELLGLTDVNDLRPLIGLSSAGQAWQFDDSATCLDVVRTAAWGMTLSWKEQYTEADNLRAGQLLVEWGLAGFSGRLFGSLSEGERKRLLLARALMPNPELLLLDEPTAGMDLPAREDLLARLDLLAQSTHCPVSVLVTHHLEEIPASTTHALLLRSGRALAQGPVTEVLTEALVSECFGLPVEVLSRETRSGRRWAVLPR